MCRYTAPLPERVAFAPAPTAPQGTHARRAEPPVAKGVKTGNGWVSHVDDDDDDDDDDDYYYCYYYYYYYYYYLKYHCYHYYH